MMLGQFVQALEDARTSVQLEPNFVKGYIRVAKCCVALGEIHAARQVCSTINIKQIVISARCTMNIFGPKSGHLNNSKIAWLFIIS